VEMGRGVRQRCCTSPILLKLYGEHSMKEALPEVGDYKIGELLLIKCDFRMT
jgi:hypothetical protein